MTGTEVYFSLLLDYYNYLTDYTSRASSLELQPKEEVLAQDKLFDMVLGYRKTSKQVLALLCQSHLNH